MHRVQFAQLQRTQRKWAWDGVQWNISTLCRISILFSRFTIFAHSNREKFANEAGLKREKRNIKTNFPTRYRVKEHIDYFDELWEV